MIEALLEVGADPNVPLTSDLAHYGTLLTASADCRKSQLFRTDITTTNMIKAGAHMNASPVGKYGSALIAAAYMGSKDGVEALINGGVNVNFKLEGQPFTSELQAAKTSIAPADHRQMYPRARDMTIEIVCGEPLRDGKLEVIQFLEQHGATT